MLHQDYWPKKLKTADIVMLKQGQNPNLCNSTAKSAKTTEDVTSAPLVRKQSNPL